MIDRLDDLLRQPAEDKSQQSTELEKTLERFDDVATNPEYKIIADLPGFAVTRESLRHYISTLGRE